MFGDMEDTSNGAADPDESECCTLPLLSVDLTGAKFPLGEISVTRNALKRIDKDSMESGLQKHARGEWGDLSSADRWRNETAIGNRMLILSHQASADGEAFWVVTEGDRSATTVMMPEDY